MALMLGALSMPAIAQQTNFAATTTLSGKQLVLNGAGTRFRTVVKVYDLALYAPRKASTLEDLLAQGGPYRVRLVALRDINPSDIGRAMVVGMRDNLPAEQAYRLGHYSSKVVEIFSSANVIPAGTEFGLDWVPGQGARFYLDGKPVGNLNDPDFIKPFLGIWIGQVPADHQLKDRLLGVK